MHTLVPLIVSGGLICVYRDDADRLLIPFASYSMVELTVVALAQYLAGLGWDWSDLKYLGPFGMGLSDGYFQIIQDGAVGRGPDGYTVVWMSITEIRDALNAQRFLNPVLADRATSLYARANGIH